MRFPRVLAAVATRIVLIASALFLFGCRHRDPASPATAGEGAHRSIPVVFYVLSGPGEVNATTDHDIVESIAYANRMFAEANIDFYVHDVRRIQTRELHRNDDGKEVLPWSAVAADAIAISPAMANEPFNDSHRLHRSAWLNQVAARQPYDWVPVFVVTFSGSDGHRSGSNCASPFPKNDGEPYYVPPSRAAPWSFDGSRGVYCQAGRGILTLAHELGHYVAGLPHTFEVTAQPDDRPETYYDLVYALDPSGRAIVRFSSPEQVRDAHRPVYPIDGNCTDCDAPTTRRVVPGTRCRLEVTVKTPNAVLVYDSERSPGAVYGLALPSNAADQPPAVNLMAYVYADPVRTPCDMRLSPSQIAVVKRRIAEPKGRRNVLGSVQRPHWSPPAM